MTLRRRSDIIATCQMEGEGSKMSKGVETVSGREKREGPREAGVRTQNYILSGYSGRSTGS